MTPTDLLGQKTALFGMTRTGKSNTTKIILKAIFALRWAGMNHSELANSSSIRTGNMQTRMSKTKQRAQTILMPSKTCGCVAQWRRRPRCQELSSLATVRSLHQSALELIELGLCSLFRVGKRELP